MVKQPLQGIFLFAKEALNITQGKMFTLVRTLLFMPELMALWRSALR